MVKKIQNHVPHSKPKKAFTRDDITFRNMDPEFRQQWLEHEEHYDRANGLDWWLEFGFPNIWEVIKLGILTPIIFEVKRFPVFFQRIIIS